MKELAEKVAMKVGEPPIMVIVDEGCINLSSYLRARVFLDLEKSLVRVVPITIKESKRYLVQYEKLPMFCFVCGLMGHELTECGDGVHDINKCQWGDCGGEVWEQLYGKRGWSWGCCRRRFWEPR
jgi:hypothetical protein